VRDPRADPSLRPFILRSARKFNIAFDGGGLIGSVEDTNDIGVKAVKLGDEILFRIALGGATGHKAFARDPRRRRAASRSQQSGCRGLRVYIERGLPHRPQEGAGSNILLEKRPFEEYRRRHRKETRQTARRAPYDAAQMRWCEP